MTGWRLILAGLGLGVVGFAASWGGWHLYTDHQLVDAIRSDIQRRQIPPPQPAGPIP